MGYILRGLVVTVILAVLTPCALAYSGGDGTAGNPYQIADVNDFMELTADPNNWDMAFILTNDIVLDPNNNPAHVFTQSPIAPTSSQKFYGSFDGNDHKIFNLTVTASGKDYIGLFGYVGSGGQVKNLGVINAAIQGRQCVGGLVGYNYFGTITSSYATGSVTGGSCVGGLVAYNASGTITSCYATGAVRGTFTGTKDVGGLVGDNSATITSCYATGAVSGSYGAGGLAGSNWGTITSCYATGAVSGFRTVGGLVGYAKNGAITSCYATGAVSGIGTSSLYVGGLVGSNSATITSCYATGSVSGGSSVGGLVGSNDGTVTSSYWDVETSGQLTSSGGTGKTVAEMQTLATFAGWDFAGVWAICEGTNYPRLQWQIPEADWVCPDGVRMEDFGYLAGHWMETTPNADLSGDGVVDLADLVIFGEFWLN